MLRSMTGYGRGETVSALRRVTVELKAVNHRYNDMNIKLPRTMLYLEDRLRKRVAGAINRGKTDVFVTVETFPGAEVQIQLNERLADAYYAQLQALSLRFGLEEGQAVLPLLARYPDVIMAQPAETDEDELAREVMAALEEALERFLEMRTREGENLGADIRKKAENIEQLVAQIEERAPLVAAEYRERLNTRLEELLSGVEVDPARLATEVTLFADRCCIDEELTRLHSHLEQLDGILEGGGPVGRKLDFLVQEMNREANTIASKANDIAVTRGAIELKSEIEKIREQIQNLE